MTDSDTTRRPDPRPKPRGSDNAARPHIHPDDPRLLDSLRPRGRRAKVAAAVAALGALALPHAASAQLDDPGRKAPDECMAVTVQRGDTVSAIARANSLTLDQIAAINGHIANLNRVWPGDEIAVTCQPDGVSLAVPQSVERGVDVSRWLDEREADGRLTWRSVVANLHAHGMRDDDLVTLAAIAECESNRWPNAEGDVHLRNRTWASSHGVWQVRALHAARGTGAPRDADALAASVSHQAWAAAEIWRQQSFGAWTCWRNGHHVGLLDTVRQAAVEIGVL